VFPASGTGAAGSGLGGVLPLVRRPETGGGVIMAVLLI
jgi:hypothetical protein